MSFLARVLLVLVTFGLLGMGVPPKPGRTEADRAERTAAEDQVLIDDLAAMEELAAAEKYEFFRSLDLLRDLPPKERGVVAEEAN